MAPIAKIAKGETRLEDPRIFSQVGGQLKKKLYDSDGDAKKRNYGQRKGMKRE